MARVVHPIEKQSYEILRARVDTSALAWITRSTTARLHGGSLEVSTRVRRIS